jgi:ABC-2 type transport system permease protein
VKALVAIIKREFFSYFVSPLAYVVLTAFLLINGYIFYLIVLALNAPDTPRTALMSLFFTNVFYWIFMMLVSSVVSMRLISEERKSGSIESLLTAPVSEATVVTGKFVGGWCFFLFLWLPTVLYPLLLARYGSVDPGPVAAGYLGIALMGALFISAGTFASSLTKNQIVAAILGFVLIFGIFLVGIFRDFVNDPKLREALTYLNLIEHMEDFARGIVDTRRIVYAVSVVVFFLFLSTRTLEMNKGK